MARIMIQAWISSGVDELSDNVYWKTFDLEQTEPTPPQALTIKQAEGSVKTDDINRIKDGKQNTCVEGVWWKVDLGTWHVITHVEVVLRGLSGRLDIIMGESLDMTRLQNIDSGDTLVCEHDPVLKSGDGEVTTVYCFNPTRGLVVMLGVENAATLCEIKVYGLGESGGDKNFALGKPTGESSHFGKKGRSHLGVDGKGCSGGRVHSNTKKRDGTLHWWQVDLGECRQIQRIRMTNYNHSCCWGRTRDFNISMSNSSEIKTRELLYHHQGRFDGYKDGKNIETFNFEGVHRGRFLTVSLKQSRRGHYLDFCEFEAFGRDCNGCAVGDGACEHQCHDLPKGYYCTCEDGFILDRSDRRSCKEDRCAGQVCENGGSCINEPIGSYQCKCTQDFTGNHCEQEKACVSNPCQNGGTCIWNQLNNTYHCNCSLGFEGFNCQSECPAGKYGKNCAKKCSQNCLDGETYCDHVTGHCMRGCEDGWQNGQCTQKCLGGKYGKNCLQNCYCSEQSMCHHVFGPRDNCTSCLKEYYLPPSCYKRKPVTISLPSIDKVNPGQIAKVMCEVGGGPLPDDSAVSVNVGSAQIVSRNGTMVYGVAPNRTREVRLEVKLLERRTDISCSAGNGYGSIIGETFELPTLSSKPNVTIHSNGSATVRWKGWDSAIDRGDGPIKAYKIVAQQVTTRTKRSTYMDDIEIPTLDTYVLSETSAARSTITHGKNRQKRTTDDTVTMEVVHEQGKKVYERLIGELKPHTSYHFGVLVGRVGDGGMPTIKPPSNGDMENVQMTPCQKPSIENVKLYLNRTQDGNLNPTLHIEWDLPPRQDWNCERLAKSIVDVRLGSKLKEHKEINEGQEFTFVGFQEEDHLNVSIVFENDGKLKSSPLWRLSFGEHAFSSAVIPAIVGVVLAIPVVIILTVVVVRRRKSTAKSGKQQDIVQAGVIPMHTLTPPGMGDDKNGGALYVNSPVMAKSAECGDIAKLSSEPACLSTDDKVEGPVYGNVGTNVDPEDHVYGNVGEELEVGMSLAELKDYIREADFAADFKSFPKGLLKEAMQSGSKSRYRGFYPYKFNRVVLSGGQGDDFINASHIKGYRNDVKYIAAQAPLEITLLDWYKMIWEQRVHNVVMVTNLKEGKKEKCHKYWPEEGEPLELDGFVVELLEETISFHSKIRKLEIWKGEDHLEVTQYHFLDWPDHGVPSSGEVLIHLRNVVRASRESGPTLVHCSAGVGRTGTFIALDCLLDQLKETQRIDVKGCILHLREQRLDMVQTQDQYRFIYDVLLEVGYCGATTIKDKDFAATYSIWRKETKKTKKCKIRRQFELLQYLTSLSSDEESAGQLEENVDKNRKSDVLPRNMNRVHLMTRIEGRNNYINAIFLPSLSKQEEYIVTQTPLPDTIVDFWRLVYDYKCHTIVMLDDYDDEEETCGVYWPVGEETLTVGPFLISSRGERTKDKVRERSLTVELADKVNFGLIVGGNLNGIRRKEKEALKVSQVWLHDVSASTLSSLSAIQLHHHVQSQREQAQGKYTLIHCRNGDKESGLFYIFTLLMSQLTAHGEINVYQAVKTVQKGRPQYIQTLEEYEVCYKLMVDYLSQFETYGNLT